MKLVLLMLSIVVSFTACGPSEQGCAENCAMAFTKSHTLCNAEHGRGTRAGMDCSNLAISENDQCSARCYGK